MTELQDFIFNINGNLQCLYDNQEDEEVINDSLRIIYEDLEAIKELVRK